MVFETERLYLREYQHSDFLDLGKILQDEETMKYFDSVKTDEGVENWINFCIKNYKLTKHSFWAVIRKSDNKFIGNCGITLQNIDGEELPEVGYHFNREFWGNGYATESVVGCIKHSTEHYKYPALYSYMTVGNTPSQKVAINAGMTLFKKYSDNNREILVYHKICL